MLNTTDPSCGTPIDNSFWAAVKLQPHREHLALNELKRNGYETYCPRILKRRFSRGKKIVTTPLLFPNYVFVAVVLQWHSARYSPGVASIVMSGDAPAHVPDSVIDELKSREHNGHIALPKKTPGTSLIDFQRGDRVRIRNGILRGCFGLYEGQAPHDRMYVLMTILGAARPIEFETADVIKL